MEPRPLSALLSFSYVGSVYLFPGARESFRNDVSVLWRRVLGVILFTGVSVYCYGEGLNRWAAFNSTSTLQATVRAVLLIHVLYMAPLFAYGYPTNTASSNDEEWLQKIRDLVVGPVTEELVYRGLITDIYINGGLSPKDVLRENFLYFGIAHMHHDFMRWLGGDITMRGAIVSSLSQFAMTSLFGTYACFLLLRTGSVWPCVVSHMLCNYLGFPRLTGGPAWYIPLLGIGFCVWAYSLKFV